MNNQTPAPTGRNNSAQGKERNDAALGHAPKNMSSPERAKEGVSGKVHQLFGEQLPKLLDELNPLIQNYKRGKELERY